MNNNSDLFAEFDRQPQNYEIVDKLINLFKTNQMSSIFPEGLIAAFINAVKGRDIAHYVIYLLRSYKKYLTKGIALIPWIRSKQELNQIKEWCDLMNIQYSVVDVNNKYEEYCATHNESLGEDDPCSQYWSDEECDIWYDCLIEEKKIIIHDDNHLGTFEEMNFKWDCRYVDGGYI